MKTCGCRANPVYSPEEIGYCKLHASAERMKEFIEKFLTVNLKQLIKMIPEAKELLKEIEK